MKTFIFMLALLILFSCGKTEEAPEEQLTGTWILDTVSGTCFGLPIEARADESGCFNIPNLEVNCLVLEFKEGGQLEYTINSITAIGSYLIEAGKINICTDNCLGYQIINNLLTLQTGTLGECNPTYSFRKSG